MGKKGKKMPSEINRETEQTQGAGTAGARGDNSYKMK